MSHEVRLVRNLTQNIEVSLAECPIVFEIRSNPSCIKIISKFQFAFINTNKLASLILICAWWFIV